MSEIGIKELARKLGISTASVSRAMSNPDRVSQEMRDKVRAAAREYGYRPNKLGASLRTAKTRNIIAIIPDISDPFNSGVIRALEQTAAEYGYSILLGDTQDLVERELAYGEMVRSKQADGIICFSHRLPFRQSDLESPSFVLPPVVNSCEDIQSDYRRNNNVPLVSIDNVAASYEITEHLISLGHKKIAVISGNHDTPSTTQRLTGYKKALHEANIEFDPNLINEGLYTLKSGRELTEQILQSGTNPTAIFCMCDESALGCLFTLKEHDINVPNDISVVGFDDIRFAKYFSPALTTIAQPTNEIGQQCVKLLIDIINGKSPKEQKMILPHRLVIRESSAPPKV